MKTSFATVVLLCYVVGSTLVSSQMVGHPSVDLTVFYETLCPYSMRFFTNQLGPTWSDLKDYINIELVPYGHVTQTYKNETWRFQCQHGDDECLYNIYHACIIDNIENDDKVVNILTCLMASKQEYSILNNCLTRYRTDSNTINRIINCINGDKGRELLSGYGNRTNNFQPKIRYVPSPVFNGVYNESVRVDAYYDLRDVLCKYLNHRPHACAYYYSQYDYGV